MPDEKQRKRNSFSPEFKQEAVNLIAKQGYTVRAAAQAVGVSEASLRQWCKKYGPAPQHCGQDASLAELKAEIVRLRRELRQAELEREILKKATAYFAKESR